MSGDPAPGLQQGEERGVVAQIQQFYQDVQRRRWAEFGPEEREIDTDTVPGQTGSVPRQGNSLEWDTA